MKPQVFDEATYLKGTTAFYVDSGSQSARNSPTGKKSVKDKSPFNKRPLFLNEPRSNKEISSDVIRADCMNHGYRLGKTIGEGAYAKVKLAEVLPAKLARNQTLADLAEETDCLQVAIKVIENKNVPKEFLTKFLPRELANHMPLEPHKNVVRVFELFRTTERVYVVMEYCCQGDLLDLINKRIGENQRGLGEENCREMFKQMCQGVQHIHNKGIVHRDLKCENILLCENNAVKVTDFGFSTKFDKDRDNLLRTSCGSYAYTAPEVIKSKPYNGYKSDIWSLGVILFAMLNGRLPFNDTQLMEMEEDMKMQRLRFERNISFDAMVLVRRILQYNPSVRPTVQEILSDSWMTGKKMIPRQMTRPKWINPYEAKTEEITLTDEEVGSNLFCYKAVPPERDYDATVIVKHEGNEKVRLKSRADSKKNIWTSGPAVVCQNRPNTWPKSEKESDRKTSRKSQGPRTYGRNGSANATKLVKNSQNKNRKNCATARSNLPFTSDDAVNLSKLLMEQFMQTTREGEDVHRKNKRLTNNCEFCKKESISARPITSKETATSPPNSQTQQSALQPNKQTQQYVSQPKKQTQIFVSQPNDKTTKMSAQQQGKEMSQKFTPHTKNQTPRKSAPPPNIRQENKQARSAKCIRSQEKSHIRDDELYQLETEFEPFVDCGTPESYCSDSISIHNPEIYHSPVPDVGVSVEVIGSPNGNGQENVCSRSCNPEMKRKVIKLSANTIGNTSYKEPDKQSSPKVSKSLDLTKKGWPNSRMSRSTNPAERVKYFKERIMRLYGSSTSSNEEDRSLLPPLMVQALRPPTDIIKPGAKQETGVRSAAGSRAWSSNSQGRTASGRSKPVQRVVVHSTTSN